ncbi:MAG TPA: CAP domain-containing protein [Solirubrobacterales bacterium]|nr:CAP domain-containing protein [Solirubrobacterales bacterium]
MSLSYRSSHILAGVAIALAFFIGVAGLAATRANASGLIAPPSKCKSVSGFGNKAKANKSMLCFTNYAREKSKLKRYRVNPKLKRASLQKAGDILRCDQFSHQACGRPFEYWIERYGFNGCAMGENIAWGNGSLGTSRSIFIAWMKSSGHRAAILSREYRMIGIGVKPGTLSGAEGARVWVQHFGAGC